MSNEQFHTGNWVWHKAEKEPVSNIEEQVESKKKDDSPIESENEEN